MFKEGKGANRVSQRPSRRRLKISFEAESTTSGGNLFHGSTMRTCGVPNWSADGEVLIDGLGDLDLLASRRTHQWGGSPSHGVCSTPRPSPRAIGDGPMTEDPVLRAVVHTRNARDLSLAESPASGDALSD